MRVLDITLIKKIFPKIFSQNTFFIKNSPPQKMPYKDPEKRKQYRKNYYYLKEKYNINNKIVPVQYPPIIIPDSIKETKYPEYYISAEGKAYRAPSKGDINRTINEYGLIDLKPLLRGNPLHKKYQYPCINVSIKDKNGNFLKQNKVYVHTLVAETFIPNPNNYDSIDHIDRNKHNNSVKNLRWCSIKDNKSFWERDQEYRKRISKSSRKNRVYGIGINDSKMNSKENPYYKKWVYILRRCNKGKNTICDDWKKLSHFESWIKQKTLDLNITIVLIKENEYNPNNCIIKINT